MIKTVFAIIYIALAVINIIASVASLQDEEEEDISMITTPLFLLFTFTAYMFLRW